MPELSPAALTIFQAFNSEFDWIEDGVPGTQFKAIAAALEALADQVVPTTTDPRLGTVRSDICRIARELKAQ